MIDGRQSRIKYIACRLWTFEPSGSKSETREFPRFVEMLVVMTVWLLREVCADGD